jgi:hypothetical protein
MHRSLLTIIFMFSFLLAPLGASYARAMQGVTTCGCTTNPVVCKRNLSLAATLGTMGLYLYHTKVLQPLIPEKCWHAALVIYPLGYGVPAAAIWKIYQWYNSEPSEVSKS